MIAEGYAKLDIDVKRLMKRMESGLDILDRLSGR